MRDSYGQSIELSSGYRCPHGNTNVGSTALRTSRHMHGDAADIETDRSREYFRTLIHLASNVGANYLPWETYPKDRHFHMTI